MRRQERQEAPYKCKARLTIRGDQDPQRTKGSTESPTAARLSQRIVWHTAVCRGWDTNSWDISRAFLRGDEFDNHAKPLDQQRQVFMKSPPEFKDIKPGQILRILKAAYGLADAPLRWMARLTRELRKIGYEPCLLDPCLFMCYDSGGHLVGIISIHVDDLQVAADDEELRRGQALLEAVFGKLKAESQHYKHTGV